MDLGVEPKSGHFGGGCFRKCRLSFLGSFTCRNSLDSPHECYSTRENDVSAKAVSLKPVYLDVCSFCRVLTRLGELRSSILEHV